MMSLMKKVLIIDDNREVTSMLKPGIELNGAKVVAYNDQ